MVTLLFCHLSLRAARPANPEIPVNPTSWGDHVRKARIERGLTQPEVAKIIGVDRFIVLRWENNKGQPAPRFRPKIVAWLGYDPMPEARTFAEQLRRCRDVLGISRVEMGRRLGVEPSGIAHWERGRCRPSASVRQRLESILGDSVIRNSFGE